MGRSLPGFKKRRTISYRKKRNVGFKKTKRGFK